MLEFIRIDALNKEQKKIKKNQKTIKLFKNVLDNLYNPNSTIDWCERGKGFQVSLNGFNNGKN
jgi:hypothetical protein